MSKQPDKPKFYPVQQVKEGETHRYYYRKNKTAVEYSVCCDCDLVHLIEYKPMKRYVRVRVWRDDDRTQELRRRNKRGKR